MIKAVGYFIVSTKNKEQESSLSNQKGIIKEHAKEKGYNYMKTIGEQITSKKKPSSSQEKTSIRWKKLSN